MLRDIFDDDHDAFRDLVRTFLAKEVLPHHAGWEKQGQVDREVWLAAGRAGLLGTDVPEEFGGGGTPDFRYNAVALEEITAAGASGLGFPLHNDVVAPYLLRLCTDEQKRRWLPGFCSGELITAIAMTEPGTGSDLQGVKTTAVMDGNHWVINGSKTFISNGQLADLVVVVAKTDPKLGAKGTSLIVVERGTEGFKRGRNLEKIGMKAQDTSELFFDNVRVPADHLLGDGTGMGFVQLMQQLPQERLVIAIQAIAAIEAALEHTIAYVKERKAFGKAILDFQNTRFKLAELKTKALVARTFVDDCVARHLEGKLDVPTAAMAKYHTTELQCALIDECLQFFGGYGYMWEYPIARLYADSRVQKIYGGTNEIMKELIARAL